MYSVNEGICSGPQTPRLPDADPLVRAALHEGIERRRVLYQDRVRYPHARGLQAGRYDDVAEQRLIRRIFTPVIVGSRDADHATRAGARPDLVVAHIRKSEKTASTPLCEKVKGAADISMMSMVVL